MAKQQFLNFKEISSSIQFSDVLDWLNIAYETKGKELRGENFIVSIEKNLFFVPDNDAIKGSVINFVSHIKNVPVREAASLLKAQFLSKIETHPKREIPNLELHYDEYLSKRGIDPLIAKEYEVGLVKERSIISGIAFKIYDHGNNHIGYVGYKEKDNSWFFPKGFKRPLYNKHQLKDTKFVIVTTDPFDALRIISLTGYKNVVSLLANSMTSEQELELKKFKYVLLIHNEPTNIVNRLCDTCFIKAIVTSKPLKEISNNELLKLIKPS